MKFEVYNQNLYARFIPLIVSGTTGYLEADFSFTEDWDGLTKTAYFYDGIDTATAKNYTLGVTNGVLTLSEVI